uniref:Formamidopyrimidine-DNA glycosylase catalytic domain-containing protein n=1 Tax=Kalanchoe fedtschenkoi TaxID=63787 RepID=A0A7N0TIJ4_KALFE
MPELPEVEAARRAIQDHCLGRIIKRAVIADDSKVIDSVSFADFQTSILGKRLLSAHRKGKNMWIQLDSPPYPSFQFGMSGAIHIKGISISKYKRSIVKDSDEWPSKYSKFLVELDDGLELSFTDPRRFAKVRLLQDPVSMPPISELGPDALLEPMSLDDFFSSLSKKKIAIKALLLDQKFISGIGNWIADEVLYQARIHPLQIAFSLSKECCATLLQCIKEVIETAIEVGADSSQYPDNWIFHFRDKKPGKAFIDGKKIDFINAGGRTTAYVPELQKLTGTQATQSAGKATKRTSKKSQDEDEEDVSDTDNVVENNRTAKSVKKQNPKGIAKKAAAKRKSNDTDEDSSGDEGGEDEDVKPVAKKMTKSKKIPAAKGRQGVTKRKLNDSDEEKESNPSDRIDEEQKPRGARSSKAKDISGETTKQGRRNKEKKAK